MSLTFSRLSLLFIALVALSCRVAADTASEAALRSQVEALKAKLQQLESRNHQLETNLASRNQAIALATGVESNGKGPRIAPSSNLEWDRAIKAATAARFMVNGASLMTVMPTGSMKPMFDEKAVLIMEPASYDDLRVGDIVTYIHPKHKCPIVHRITEKRGDKFWTKGDNNARMDDTFITRENYQARVFGIIYAKEASKK